MPALPEPEVMIGQRAFPTAQALFNTPPLPGTSRYVQTGWHDTATYPLEGAFALIDPESGLDDLIGEVLAVHFAGRTVFVYCYTLVGLPYPLSLYRRAFLGLDLLTTKTILARVEIAS